MRTGFVGLEGQPGGICSCCTDCCFPHQASRRLGIAGQWPWRRHVAAVDAAACTLCGRCTKRCPFAALTLAVEPADGIVVAAAPTAQASEAGEGPRPGRLRSLFFAADRCRGCGLCTTGCPDDAIAMEPRPASA